MAYKCTEIDTLRRAMASGVAFESKVGQLLRVVGEKNHAIAELEADKVASAPCPLT